MARPKAKKGSKQTALTGSGFWPMLSKPAIAIGKHASVPGKYWNGCPAADKEKRFMCIVVEFTAMHDFGDGVKGAGFKMKEMGENGNGSLEPGVASGSEFIMAYPLPFLEHYFFQNRSELPDAVREKAFPAEAVIAAGADGGGAADEHLVQLCRGCLAALTELEQVAGENLLVRRLVCRVVYPNGCPDGEAVRVHLAVVVREGAGAREELLTVGLVREVRSSLPEDDPITILIQCHCLKVGQTANLILNSNHEYTV